jgi:hypothetical protein
MLAIKCEYPEVRAPHRAVLAFRKSKCSVRRASPQTRIVDGRQSEPCDCAWPSWSCLVNPEISAMERLATRSKPSMTGLTTESGNETLENKTNGASDRRQIKNVATRFAWRSFQSHGEKDNLRLGEGGGRGNEDGRVFGHVFEKAGRGGCLFRGRAPGGRSIAAVIRNRSPLDGPPSGERLAEASGRDPQLAWGKRAADERRQSSLRANSRIDASCRVASRCESGF